MWTEVLNSEHLQNRDFIRTMINLKEGQITSRSNGVSMWNICSYFDQWNWVIVYSLPLKAKYSAAYYMRRILIMVTFITTSLMILGVSFAVTRFIQPVIQLKQVADQIGAGDLEKKAKVYSSDEVGRLAISFNDMTSQLNNSLVELKHQINVRKSTEQSLRRTEERLKMGLSSAKMGTWRWDAKTNLDTRDGSLNRILGFEDVETTQSAEDFSDHIHPDDRDIVSMELKRAVREHDTYLVEFRIVQPNGNIRWVRDRGEAFYDDKDELVYATGAIVDITERKKAEELLQESEKKFRSLTENAPVGIAVTALDGAVLEVNPAILDMFGYDSKEEYLSESILTHYSNPIDRQYFIEEVEKGVVKDYQLKLKHKDGTVFWATLNSTKQIADDGSVQLVNILQDISQRKRTEAELKQLLKTLESKNNELQSIVYVASHDLKSPLVNITGFGDELSTSCRELQALLKDNAPDESKKIMIEALLEEHIPESLQFITAGATKIEMLLDGLLQVSRVGTAVVNIEPIDMNSLFAQVLETVQFKVKTCGVTVDLDENLPGCRGDIAKTNQVFSNLVGNALKYLDPNRHGKIHISGWIEDNMVIYCVEDNGMGIAAGHLNKIFEMFHRLNPDDSVGGEGLGLSIVMRILDRLNGSIRVESEPGKGSKFFVTLPTTER
jgi:PAS domain S-box-containing protein